MSTPHHAPGHSSSHSISHSGCHNIGRAPSDRPALLERAALIIAAAQDAARFTQAGDYEQARSALDRIEFLGNEQWHELLRHEQEHAV